MKEFLFYKPEASGVDWKRIDSLRHVMEKRTASIYALNVHYCTQNRFKAVNMSRISSARQRRLHILLLIWISISRSIL